MDHATESMRARVNQFKRDRWPYVIGHVGATLALIGISWNSADHSSLLWFGLVHHLATWVLAISVYLPLRSKHVERIPLWTYLGVIVANATLSSALLFDLASARELTFALAVAAVLLAGAGGSYVTLGVHPTLIRTGVASILLPFVVISFFLGHIVLALSAIFYFLNVAVAGVWKISSGHQELISLRIDAAHRAEIAEVAAETDHLTGLVNRRGLKQLDGMRLSAGATALYFDVNNFKEINDTLGHSIGDEILQIVAQRLRGAMSADDIVARLGGDEFLVLIFKNEAIVIDAVIKRLCHRLQDPASVSDGKVLAISAAIGHSCTSASVLKLDDLLRDSDRAMYQSKARLKQTAVTESNVGRQSTDQVNATPALLPQLDVNWTSSTLPSVSD